MLFANPPIGQALASDSLERQIGAVRIAVAKRRAGVIAEAELFAVALQVLRGNVVEGADQTTLEHREETFHSVRMSDAAHVLSLGVVDLLIGLETVFTLEQVVARAAVRHDVRIGVDLRLKNQFKVLAGDAGDVEGANLAAALD